MTTTLDRVFCDRPMEMRQLRDAYERCLSEQRTQVIGIIGNSGLGKTRLVMEFYRWLSDTHDSGSDGGYWPAKLRGEGQALEYNPRPSLCNHDFSPPFFWTGMRLHDPSARNAHFGSVVPNGAASFGAHLGELYAYYQAKKPGGKVKSVFRSVGIDFASDKMVDFAADLIPIPGLKVLFSVARAVYDVEKEKNGSEVLSSLPPVERYRQVEDVVVNGWLDTLSALYSVQEQNRQVKQIGRVLARPFVLFIDDAQWIEQDPALIEFLTKTISHAAWPLLVVFTCWEVDWHKESPIRQIAESNQNVVLNVIKLAPHENLLPVVEEALPGVNEVHRRSFMEKAGGNPAALQILIGSFVQNPKYFDELDISRDLNPLGQRRLQDSIGLSEGIRKLAESVLQDVGHEFRSVLAISAWQGVRFLKALSIASTQALGKSWEVESSLKLAERPCALIEVDVAGVNEFTQRIYWEVARESLDNYVAEAERDALLRVLPPTILAILDSNAERSIVLECCEVTLRLYKDYENDDVALMLCRTALELSNAARRRFDFLAARSYAELFYDVFQRVLIDISAFDASQLLLLADSLEYANVAAAARLIEQLLPALALENDQRMYAAALGQAARVARKSGSSDAYRLAWECLRGFRKIFEHEANADSARDLSVALGLMSDVSILAGALEQAQRLANEALEVLAINSTSSFPSSSQIRDASHAYARLSRIVLNEEADRAYDLALESVRLARLNVASEVKPYAERDLALSLLTLVDAAIELRRIREARDAIVECVSLLTALNKPGQWTSVRDLALALWRSSRVHALDREYDLAKRDLDKSIKLLETEKGQQSIVDLILACHRARRLSTDHGDFEWAERYGVKALELYHLLDGQIGNVYERADSMEDHLYLLETMRMSPSLATRWFLGRQGGINPEDL